jgi:hypothetical protein
MACPSMGWRSPRLLFQFDSCKYWWIISMEKVLFFLRISLVGGFNHLEKYESQWEG